MVVFLSSSSTSSYTGPFVDPFSFSSGVGKLCLKIVFFSLFCIYFIPHNNNKINVIEELPSTLMAIAITSTGMLTCTGTLSCSVSTYIRLKRNYIIYLLYESKLTVEFIMLAESVIAIISVSVECTNTINLLTNIIVDGILISQCRIITYHLKTLLQSHDK